VRFADRWMPDPLVVAIFLTFVCIATALQLAADIAQVLMVLTTGESWTNTVQPLYAISVLAVARLRVRDVMVYGVTICILLGTIYLNALYFF